MCSSVGTQVVPEALLAQMHALREALAVEGVEQEPLHFHVDTPEASDVEECEGVPGRGAERATAARRRTRSDTPTRLRVHSSSRTPPPATRHYCNAGALQLLRAVQSSLQFGSYVSAAWALLFAVFQQLVAYLGFVLAVVFAVFQFRASSSAAVATVVSVWVRRRTQDPTSFTRQLRQRQKHRRHQACGEQGRQVLVVQTVTLQFSHLSTHQAYQHPREKHNASHRNSYLRQRASRRCAQQAQRDNQF